MIGFTFDDVGCEVFKARGSVAVGMVIEYSEVEPISTQLKHCVNSSNYSMMSSYYLIPFVGFQDKVVGKVHMVDLGFWIGCIVGKEGRAL